MVNEFDMLALEGELADFYWDAEMNLEMEVRERREFLPEHQNDLHPNISDMY